MKRYLKAAALLTVCLLALSLVCGCAGVHHRRRSVGRIFVYDIPDGEITEELRALYRDSPATLMRPVYDQKNNLYCYGAGVCLTDWDQKQPIEYQVFPHNYDGDYADVVFYLSDEDAGYPILAELVALPHQTTDTKVIDMIRQSVDAPGIQWLDANDDFEYFLYLFDAAYHELEDETVIRRFDDTCAYLAELKDHLRFVEMVDYVAPEGSEESAEPQGFAVP